MKSKRHNRSGQTTIEATVVLTGLIFLTFTVVNLAVLMHTRMLGTYAAFMAGRSFQVLGDQTGADVFSELIDEEDQTGGSQEFLADMRESKYPAFFRVAEDIFTCGLPWMSVPAGDELEAIDQNSNEDRTLDERCQAGKRKYETFNIATPVFVPWDPANAKMDSVGMGDDASGLEKVDGAYREFGRDPLRYGVLRLAYRTPILFDPFGTYAGEFHTGEVFVPVLLNPGLRIELQKKDDKDPESDFKNSAFVQENK